MLARTLLIVGAAAASLLLAPTAVAAPTADAQGYVDSTARCAPPDEAVLFGSTGSSRVAICKSPDGEYEYRGVRVRDGAKLIVPASPTGDEFTAENDGITYFVSEDSLTISAGTRVIREEPMVDVHEGQVDDTPSAPPVSTPTPTKPLPPPLPAEEGHTES
ncbi:hypothetical protein A5765_20505 [Mycolicibacterium celeriflavum]|uniref:hypothetical protein n=1 Tax=Mycolicibacterium celeriflavum TaxID=1249101 RepID=UPI0008007347|nr:hypothetical protein [Mycolicibacterium celeriflavum]OBG22506.1 hypothetical protein A5765_20505 [Mycolicibacterium celeriflavum]